MTRPYGVVQLENDLNKESSSDAYTLYLAISIFRDSCRRVGVVPVTEALKILFAQQFFLSRSLLVKQGYFLFFHVKLILYELGYSIILIVSVERVQQGANYMGYKV